MYSFVAMLNWVTALPLARLRISGSRVRRPVNRTLFTVRVLLLDRSTSGRSILRSGGNECGGQVSEPERSSARGGAGPGGRAIRRVDGPSVVGGPWTGSRSAEPARAWRAVGP